MTGFPKAEFYCGQNALSPPQINPIMGTRKNVLPEFLEGKAYLRDAKRSGYQNTGKSGYFFGEYGLAANTDEKAAGESAL